MSNKWTATEDQMVIDFTKWGYTYAEMVAHLPGRSQDAIRNRAFHLRRKKFLGTAKKNQAWFDGLRIGFLDIETSDFKDTFGTMISWAMYIPGRLDGPQSTCNPEYIELSDDEVFEIEQWAGMKKNQVRIDYPSDYNHENQPGIILHDVWTRRDAINIDRLDKKIVRTLVESLQYVDMIVTYWGKGFDVPFMRGRSFKWGWDDRFPRVGEKFHIDLFFRARQMAKHHRNSLQVHTEYLGIDGKDHVEGNTWQAAKLGYADALAYVDHHCAQDVVILKRLYDRYKPFFKLTKVSI